MQKSMLGAAFVLGGIAMSVAGCGGDSASDAAKLQEIEALRAKLTALSEQALQIEDIRAIKLLQRAWGYYVDQNMWSEVVDLFAEDGSLEVARNGVYVGKERIRKYLLLRGTEGLVHGEINEHMIVQPVITLAEDGLAAKGRWRAIIVKGNYQKEATFGEGPYENEYVKEGGVWKFKTVHWFQTYAVNVDGGWAKNKDVTSGRTMPADYPPDRPSTFDYEPWPGVFVPPFHFKNPVTGRE